MDLNDIPGDKPSKEVHLEARKLELLEFLAFISENPFTSVYELSVKARNRIDKIDQLLED